MNTKNSKIISAVSLFVVSALKKGVEIIKPSPASIFCSASALILSFTFSSCRAPTRSDDMESGAAAKVTHSQAPRVPGFTYLREETFSCGGQTNTMQIYRHDRTGLEFVLVPGGVFRMGANSNLYEEKPVHTVRVKPFLLCRTECTQAGWDEIGGKDERKWKDADLPIESVNWNEVTAWCRKAGLRLPTEAEWEYACRAGSTTRYYFGDSKTDLGEYAWCSDQWHSDHSSVGRTHPVGQKKPNAFGLYDMHGNVWEWCQDWYHNSYHGAPDDGSAWTKPSSSYRIVRGPAFKETNYYCPDSSAIRFRFVPSERNCLLGFRPAADVPSGD